MYSFFWGIGNGINWILDFSWKSLIGVFILNTVIAYITGSILLLIAKNIIQISYYKKASGIVTLVIVSLMALVNIY